MIVESIITTLNVDGRVNIAGDPNHPANFGHLCSKGHALGETLGMEGRLLHPEIKGVRASTIRLIRNHRHLIDDDFRKDIRNTSLFMELLRSPERVSTELKRMNRYGIRTVSSRC